MTQPRAPTARAAFAAFAAPCSDGAGAGGEMILSGLIREDMDVAIAD
jgi:hypothetical protein